MEPTHTFAVRVPGSTEIHRDGKPFACVLPGIHEYPRQPDTPTGDEIRAFAALAARAPAMLAALRRLIHAYTASLGRSDPRPMGPGTAYAEACAAIKDLP